MTSRAASLALFLLGLVALPGGMLLIYNGGTCGDPAAAGASLTERIGDALTEYCGGFSPLGGLVAAAVGAVALAVSAYLDKR